MRRCFLPMLSVVAAFYVAACGKDSDVVPATRAASPKLELVYKEKAKTIRYASGVEIKDGFVFVIGNKPLLTVYDARTVGQMNKVAEIDEYIGVDINVRRAVNVSFLSGGHLYIHGSQGFVAINVKDPRKPMLLSVTKNLWLEEKDALTVDGDYAYLASLSGLTVVDVKNPAMPEKLYEKADLFNVVRDMAVVGKTLYVLDANNLHAFDIADPRKPVKLEITVPTTNLVLARMCKVEDVLYIMATSGTLSVLAAGNPSALELKGTFPLYSYEDAYHIQDVRVVGNRLYFANERDLFMFDLKDAAKPKFIVQASGVGPINAIEVDEQAIYVAADYENLVVLKNQPPH